MTCFEDLAQITDPRQQRGRQHPLGVVLAVAVAAVRAGVDPDALPQPIAERVKEPFALGLQPLLTTHLTFREVGGRLHLSPHTVKTQAVSIYRKLGVSSRSQAIHHAQQLGLLPA